MKLQLPLRERYANDKRNKFFAGRTKRVQWKTRSNHIA